MEEENRMNENFNTFGENASVDNNEQPVYEQPAAEQAGNAYKQETNMQNLNQQSSNGQNSYAQNNYNQNNYNPNNYNQNGYAQGGYSQNGYNQNAYHQNGYGQNPYSQNPYSQNTYGQNSYSQNPYNQNSYGEPWQNRYRKQPEPKKEGQGFGIAALVLGICSLILFCSCINIPLAILALIFGIVQLTRNGKKGLAVGGIATAVASIICCIVFWGVVIAEGYSVSDLLDEYGSEYSDEIEIPQFYDDITNNTF